jgi:hypothetical protein
MNTRLIYKERKERDGGLGNGRQRAKIGERARLIIRMKIDGNQIRNQNLIKSYIYIYKVFGV